MMNHHAESSGEATSVSDDLYFFIAKSLSQEIDWISKLISCFLESCDDEQVRQVIF